MSGAREQANGRVSGPVLPSGFLVILAHSEFEEDEEKEDEVEEEEMEDGDVTQRGRVMDVSMKMISIKAPNLSEEDGMSNWR